MKIYFNSKSVHSCGASYFLWYWHWAIISLFGAVFRCDHRLTSKLNLKAHFRS